MCSLGALQCGWGAAADMALVLGSSPSSVSTRLHAVCCSLSKPPLLFMLAIVYMCACKIPAGIQKNKWAMLRAPCSLMRCAPCVCRLECVARLSGSTHRTVC